MRDTILWVYIVLLLVGGVFGFIKGKSKISLISSVLFAGALGVSILTKYVTTIPFSEILLGLLLVVFGIRLAKTKKFMPSGLMLALTAATLALRVFVR